MTDEGWFSLERASVELTSATRKGTPRFTFSSPFNEQNPATESNFFDRNQFRTRWGSGSLSKNAEYTGAQKAKNCTVMVSHAEPAATGAPLGVSRLSVAASYPYAGLCGVSELCL
jgi:hypothetical protein